MESRSPADESHPTLRESRLFTCVTMEVYRQAALANYAEAEDLLEKALQLREAGHALLDRAAVLAGQYASLEDSREETLEEAFLATEDHIHW